MVLEKPGKSPENVKNYRPISLLNIDYKIYASILAKRLALVIGDLVHPDQCGFIPGRSTFDNARLLCNLIDRAAADTSPYVALSLDAEKAFDRLEWSFLFSVLTWFGLREDFINKVKLLYAKTSARVFANGRLHRSFSLHRGTRQGCPLSPLLFDLALEPLALAVRQSEAILGLNFNGLNVKLSAYADDLLLFTQPQEIPQILTLINNYSSLSGYKINWDKSVAFPLNGCSTIAMMSPFPFRWEPAGIKYLGAWYSASVADTIRVNVEELTRIVRSKISAWSPLYLTWWGRLEVIKMVLVPKIHYVLGMLPFTIPIEIFTELERTLLGFLWKDVQPRIALRKLKAPKDKEGVHFPDFQWYHHALLIKQGTTWLDTEVETPGPRWLQVEARAAGSYPLKHLLGMLHPEEGPQGKVIRATQAAFLKLVHIAGGDGLPSRRTPLWRNPLFKIGGQRFAWKDWQERGIWTLGHIVGPAGLKDFNSFRAEFSLPQSSYFRWLQIKHSILAARVETRNLVEEGSLILNLKAMYEQKGMIAGVYALFRDYASSVPRGLYRVWESELSVVHSFDMWAPLWGTVTRASRSAAITQSMYFLLHRAHLIPVKVSKWDRSSTGNCWSCQRAKGTFLHMFYECPFVQSYWREVWHKIQVVLGIPDQLSKTVVFLRSLGLSQDGHRSKDFLLNFMMAVAFKLILVNWKTLEKLRSGEWWSLVCHYAKYERIYDKLHHPGSGALCHDKWLLLDQYVAHSVAG